jgi:DNA-binding Lrp family transcriptional regulator
MSQKWYQAPQATNLINPMDIDQVIAFLRETPRELRYRVSSISNDKFRSSVSASSIEKMIKLGHHDLQIWLYVNFQIKKAVYDSGEVRTKFESARTTESFVIDFDDLEDIWNINDLLFNMDLRGVPLPQYITQTSSNGFHCLYLGVHGEWPSNKRFWLLKKWAKIKNPMSHEECVEAIRESGVDVNYSVNSDIGNHAIRIPGSLNQNHPQKEGGFWKCVSWKNQEYSIDKISSQFLEETGQAREEFIPDSNVEALVPKYTKPNPAMFIKPVEELLHDILPEGFNTIKIQDIARMISKNSGWLIKNECRIHQVTWAEELGCQQYEVSLMIKRLINLGVLSKINDLYRPMGFSKTYGAGELLKPAIGYGTRGMQQPSWVRWDDGTSWSRMLYDVRYFVSIGLKDDEIIRKLNERQAHRPLKKQRKISDMHRCVVKYRNWKKNNSRHSDNIQPLWLNQA